MYTQDPIADMLTRIRNSILVDKTIVEVPYSKLKEKILKKLLQEQYIKNYKIISDKKFKWKKTIEINLKYVNNVCVIRNLKRISGPKRRIYTGKEKIPSVYNNLGMALISTSKGILTDIEARKMGIGGEILAYIW